jgi:hypothetical protein
MQHELDAIITPVLKLNRDMVKALRADSDGITDTEARFLVDLYYTMQDQRVRVNNQVKGLDRDAKKAETEAEPHEALDWTLTQFATLESQVAKLLGIYTESHPMAWFFDQTIGIGPILAAGLLAHIDITKAPTAGHIWRFAGLDPTMKWEKKTKRPWNADLKKLCWKIGDSFVKFSNHPDGLYGQIYRKRKAYEWERNLSGANAGTADNALEAKKYGKETDAKAWYSGECDPEKARALLDAGKALTASGCKGNAGVKMLPPAQIDMRARRYAVKLFLSHLQETWWRETYQEAPPKPFAISIQGHAHYLAPPQTKPQPHGHAY